MNDSNENWEERCELLQAHNDNMELMLGDLEEKCEMLQKNVDCLNAIKATIEVIFGRKFNV